MKLVNEEAKDFETNYSGDSQEFGIGDVSVIIDILRNRLYRHKIRTLVQEYLCNARDANREAGTDKPVKIKPVKITVPTTFEPTFKVRDYGPGVSPDRMQNVFINYGASTKRDANTETGGFGIGAKSAWSYTDSFTIKTFIDGVQRTYVAHTGDSKTGKLDLIEEKPTDESNGTQVEIAINPHEAKEFQEASLRAVYFWSEAFEFTNFEAKELQEKESHKGEFLTNYFEVGLTIPSFITGDVWGGRTKYAIVDGIPYDISNFINQVSSLNELVKLLRADMTTFALYVPTGFLEVSASREELSDSQHTLKNLEAVCKKLVKKVKSHINSRLNKTNSIKEYARELRTLSQNYDMSDFCKYDNGNYTIVKGSILGPIIKSIDIVTCHGKGIYENSVQNLEKISSLHDTGRKSYLRNISYIDVGDLDEIYYIDTDESKIKQNQRIRSRMIEKGQHPGRLIILRPDEENGLIAEFEKAKKDLKAKPLSSIEIKKEDNLAPKKAKKSSQKICIHYFTKKTMATRHEKPFLKRTKDISVNAPHDATYYLYIPMERGQFKGYSSLEIWRLSEFFKDKNVCIVGIASSAIKKIEDNPSFEPLSDYLSEYKPTRKDFSALKVLYIQSSDINTIQIKNLNRFKTLKDPYLKRMKDLNKDFGKANKKLLDHAPAEIIKLIEKVFSKEYEAFKQDVENFNKYLDHYPLLKEMLFDLDTLNEASIKDLENYINQKALYRPTLNKKQKGVK